MPERVAIAVPYEGPEIDLWGTVYETVDMARSKAKAVEELERKFFETEEDDEAVEVLCQAFDIRFRAPNGKGPKPSTVVRRKWKSDGLTANQIFGFLARLKEAEDGRPRAAGPQQEPEGDSLDDIPDELKEKLP